MSAPWMESRPESVKRLLDYHIQNSGISRYHKFQYFYEQLHPVKNVESCVKNALVRFSEIVRQGMMECDYVPGALEFLESSLRVGLRLFVSSGSDEKELNEVFQERDISRLFEKIYGSPATKLENTQKIADIVGRGKRGVFFGDSRSDAEAAESAGLDFVFVKGTSSWEDGEAAAEGRGDLIIHDFNGNGVE